MSKRVKAEYDLVIVGSGIAGLSFALKVAEAGYRVAIFTKKDKAESNTNYAQGGIAAVTSAGDDLDKHVEDTLEAGDGLCDPEIVREILRDGPARIQDLAEMGVSFSSLDDGRISLGIDGEIVLEESNPLFGNVGKQCFLNCFSGDILNM